MKKTVKTRPDRYLKREQAIAYHSSTNANGKPTLSQRLELAAVRRAITSTGGGQSVLDAPCGTGRIDMLLRQRFETVIGLDSSVPMLSVYQQSERSRTGCCGDLFQLPFENETFDWIFCHRYFHHLNTQEERIRLLSSLRQTCRKGVVVYAWVNTHFSKRKSSMRTSVSRPDILDAIDSSDLTLQSMHRCAGPFSVKTILVCTRS